MTFSYPLQLTKWDYKKNLVFAEEQLKHGRNAIENVDYEWREKGKLSAIFVLRKEAQ